MVFYEYKYDTNATDATKFHELTQPQESLLLNTNNGSKQ